MAARDRGVLIGAPVGQPDPSLLRQLLDATVDGDFAWQTVLDTVLCHLSKGESSLGGALFLNKGSQSSPDPHLVAHVPGGGPLDDTRALGERATCLMRREGAGERLGVVERGVLLWLALRRHDQVHGVLVCSEPFAGAWTGLDQRMSAAGEDLALVLALNANAPELAETHGNDTPKRAIPVLTANAAASPSCVITARGRITSATGAWHNLTGWHAEELEGRRLSTLLGGTDRIRLRTQTDGLQRGHGIHNEAIDLKHRNGSTRIAHFNAWLSPTGDSVALQFHDITTLSHIAEQHAWMQRVNQIAQWSMDLETRRASWSDTMHHLLDTDPETYDPSSTEWARFLPEHEAAHLRNALRLLISDGQPIDREVPVITAKSRPRWMRLRALASRDGGAIRRVYGTLQDVTDLRRQAAHAQRASAVLDGLIAAVVICNANAETEWVNPAYCDLTGHKGDTLVGLPAERVLLGEGSLADDQTVLRAAFHLREELHRIVPFLLPDGQVRHVDLTLKPMDAKGDAAGSFIAMLIDVTERVEATERMARAERSARNFRTKLIEAVEALPDGFVYFDSDDRLELFNEQYRNLYPESARAMETGVRFEDILRYGLANGQYADALGREEEWLEQRLAAHRSDNVMLEQELGDGRWMRIIERQTQDGGRVGLRIDITALKRKEAELRSANANLEAALRARDIANRRFADIASVSTDWFWEQDAELRFTYLSNSYRASAGLEPSALVGRRREELPQILRQGPESATWDAVYDRIEARLPFRDFVYPFRRPDGVQRWFCISGAPYEDANGDFGGYRGVGTDITDLYEAKLRAEQASAAKSTFLATMSHEIRTPLNGVLGLAEELDERITDPDQKRLVQTIRGSGGLLLNIINDILDFSKIEAGKLELEDTRLWPTELIQRTAAMHAHRAKEKGLTLNTHVADACTQARLGDPHRIMQILANLISNAVKFSEKGHVDLTVEPGADDHLVFVVTDSGIGMNQAQIARLFDDFSQAETSTTRRFGGTGLGMAIVARLVEMMDGTIEVSSQPQKGTRISVSLPLPPDDTAAGEIFAAPECSTTPVKSELPSGLRVLAADDTGTNRMLMDLVLRRLGAEAEIVADGRSAVSAFERALDNGQPFDVMLLDISMPEMDGIEALTHIQHIARQRNLQPCPALAVTANVLSHQIEGYLGKGFRGHVAKPLQRDVLATEMARVISA